MAESVGNSIYDLLFDLYGTKDYNKQIQETLLKLRNNNKDFDDNDNARKFYKWAKSHRQLKVVSAVVPFGVLPTGIEISLHDIRVSVPRHGPDDKVYDGSKEIRKKVARGNCFLEIHKGPSTGMTCIIYALKKFTGGLGDDDDKDRGDNHTWKRYFTKPLEVAETIVCTQKANGEAAHLSAFSVGEEVYFCGGSKNVHLIFRNREDINRYTEERFKVAKEVCTAVLDLVDTFSSEQKSRLLQFLSKSRLTGIFEILCPGHQHVEDLSHLHRSELRFITWTSNSLDPPEEEQLCYMPPHIAIEISRGLGLPTVDYCVIPVSKNEEKMTEIRKGYGYEGMVLYFLDAEDNVIGILKKKTIWYIICRAIREKVKYAVKDSCRKPDTFSVSKKVEEITRRLTDIQSWLGLDDHSLKEWTTLGTHYLKWCLHNINNGSITSEEVADLFPVIWKRFLAETGQTDDIKSKWEEPQGSDE